VKKEREAASSAQWEKKKKRDIPTSQGNERRGEKEKKKARWTFLGNPAKEWQPHLFDVGHERGWGELAPMIRVGRRKDQHIRV